MDYGIESLTNTTFRDPKEVREYIKLQAESLTLMIKGFGIKPTLENLLFTLCRFLTDKNRFVLGYVDSAAIMTEFWTKKVLYR